jgi:Leucine-rich repeat (LRR) protein
LSGAIPSELGNLSNLEYLYLRRNQLSGAIPSELGNLSNLSTLNFIANQLSGAIPSELGNLSNLSSLHLSANQLSGAIPSEFGNLSSLSSLGLFENQLSGAIPSELGNLSNLEFLSLRNNQLSGSIPIELGNLSNLGYLYLYSNQLSGVIPESICNLNLFLYNISGNQLCPPYPDCIDVGEQDCQETEIVSSILPLVFSLSQNYPNPFNPVTTIEYALPEQALVHLSVFNIAGQCVAKLVNASQPAGYYSIQFSPSQYNLSTGVYFYHLRAGDFNQIRKMVYIK